MHSTLAQTKIIDRPTTAQIGLTLLTCALALMMQTLLAKAQYSGAPAYNSHAKTPQGSHGLPYKLAFAHKFNELMRGLNNSECIGTDKANRVAFLGIPANNVHLGEFVRKSLNVQALEEINRQYGNFVRFDAVDNLQLAARLDANNAQGRSSVERSIEALLKTSPYVLAMRTARPQKDAVQIKIDLLARSKDGVTRCSKSAELIIKLANFTIIDASTIDTRENRNFVQSKWIYPFILKQFSNDIIHFKRLRVINEFAMSGTCELRNKAASQFRSSYFDVRRSSAGRFASARKDWPRLRLEKAASKPNPSTLKVEPKDGILYLRYALSKLDRDVVDVTMEIYNKGDVVNSSHLSMLIDPRNLKGCTQKSADPLLAIHESANPKGLIFELGSSREIYTVGRDNVEFVIRSKQPLYFYCLSIGADGTSRLAFPWSRTQLATPSTAGQSRTYPTDFGLTPFVLQQEARELFGCYASSSRLPVALENRWLASHPFNAAKTGGDGVLSYFETRKLLEELDNTPKTGSAFTWLRAKK